MPLATAATGVKWPTVGARQPSTSQLVKLFAGSGGTIPAAGSPRHAASLLPAGGSTDMASAAAASQAAAGIPEGARALQLQQQASAAVSLADGGSGSSASELLALRSQHGGLMRLGLIMAATMTLHNLPEGFAVAFSAFTDLGGSMALAIAMHNVSRPQVRACLCFCVAHACGFVSACMR